MEGSTIMIHDPGKRACPYCAEDIAKSAVRCPFCRSRLALFEAAVWHRDHPERRVAGVCAALAHALAVPVTLVRVAFVLLTLFVHVAPLAYLALWVAIPRRPGADPVLERGLERARDELRRWRHADAGSGPGGPTA